MLKAFAIAHQAVEHRADGVPRIVRVIYGADVEDAARYALNESVGLEALNAGKFSVIAIYIDGDDHQSEDVHICLANSDGLWRFAYCRFSGLPDYEIRGVINLQTVPFQFLED